MNLPAPQQPDRDAADATFDGIICIGGEDWWYHNRGHFDFQVMRRLARRWPVLFVNSIGVRFPTLGGDRARQQVFAARISRKLRSLSRGLVHVENGFHVYSPVIVPGRAGRLASGWALAPQIRVAARRLGIERPLLWIHCPPGASLIGSLGEVAVVLQRTDRFEAFPEGDSRQLGQLIGRLKQRADLVVYCNDELRASEAVEVRRSLLVTHGVELERFSAAGDQPGPWPADIDALPRPRAVFVGGVDHHTFDSDLFNGVAGQLPGVSFALVGGCSLPQGWCPHRNVHLLGRKPYDEVDRYMAAADVLIMPWNDSEWIRACNPIKLKEYLAVGRPVVTTDFPALAPYRCLVRVARGADEFAAMMRSALSTAADKSQQRNAIAGESWDAKADLIADEFAAMGLTWSATPSIRGAAA